MAELDLLAIATQATEPVEARLIQLNLPPGELEDNTTVLGQFSQIAAQMLAEEGLVMEGMDAPITLDEERAGQTFALFAEGIFMAMQKCAEFGITDELKRGLLQTLALNVFNDTKQVVISTYGQEHTPDFQFPYEQQVNLIHQSAESALLHFINEYEKEHGPIFEPEEAPQATSDGHAAVQGDGGESPQPAASQPAAAARQQQVPARQGSPHEKYAAVALFLTTLPPAHRQRMLGSFNGEEKELIAYYSEPAHIEQNLNLAAVQTHLAGLKRQLNQSLNAQKNDSQRGIARLVKSNPLEKLLSCVKDERPGIQQYLAAQYGMVLVEEADNNEDPGEEATQQAVQATLPPRLELLLYRHLERRLKQAPHDGGTTGKNRGMNP